MLPIIQSRIALSSSHIRSTVTPKKTFISFAHSDKKKPRSSQSHPGHQLNTETWGDECTVSTERHDTIRHHTASRVTKMENMNGRGQIPCTANWAPPWARESPPSSWWWNTWRHGRSLWINFMRCGGIAQARSEVVRCCCDENGTSDRSLHHPASSLLACSTCFFLVSLVRESSTNTIHPWSLIGWMILKVIISVSLD